MFFWVYMKLVAKRVQCVIKAMEMFDQNVNHWDFVSHYTY